MSTVQALPTSGCARRRAKAIRNRDNVTALVHKIEEADFNDHGTIPASSTAVSICPCGARAFTRNEDGDLGDFADRHAFCDEATA